MFEANDIRNATSHKKATEMVRSNLAESDKWLIRGLLAIYARQTHDEQSQQTTKHDNEVGFNGLDAPILSSFAVQVRKHENDPHPRFPNPLSPKQLRLARKKMLKYAGQLAGITRKTQAQPVAS